MNAYLNNDTVRLVVQTSFLIILFVIITIIYKYAFSWARKSVAKTSSKTDDYVLELFRSPLLVFIFWFILNILIRIFYHELSFFSILLHLNNLLLIFSLSWLAVQFITAVAFYIQSTYDINVDDNLRAKKSLTQIKVFRAIAVTIIVIIAIGAGLMTFEQAREVGISVLTSAGIMGIIVGFAAQKSLGMILAGMQLAITQPIRLDDIVTVEGEFGKIEEIALTYVVVKIWDERRMILPVTWFLEKPFMNWTRSDSAITGFISLFVDYDFPVDSIRKLLPELLKENKDWDGRISSIQVTDTTERFKEIRILLSSSDSSKNWNLKTAVRESMIDYINANFPDTFAKIRIKTV